MRDESGQLSRSVSTEARVERVMRFGKYGRAVRHGGGGCAGTTPGRLCRRMLLIRLARLPDVIKICRNELQRSAADSRGTTVAQRADRVQLVVACHTLNCTRGKFERQGNRHAFKRLRQFRVCVLIWLTASHLSQGKLCVQVVSRARRGGSGASASPHSKQLKRSAWKPAMMMTVDSRHGTQTK